MFISPNTINNTMSDKKVRNIEWKELTDVVQREFTLNNQIKVIHYFFENHTEKSIFYSKDIVNNFIEIAKNDGIGPTYPYFDVLMHETLKKFSIAGHKVAIIGSTRPWYESLCLAYGGIPTTIEYNKIKTDHPDIVTMTVREYENNPLQFDSAFSISTFEHDGLGRYGDPIDPNGDLKAMKKTKNMLKKGGFLFINVPFGKDEVLWNAHRVYGEKRWPMLIEGWKVIEQFGNKQRVYVLENL